MPTNNSLNTIYSSAFYPCLNGCKYIPINFSNLASGNNDLYTVPSGKKAICYQGIVYNANGSSRTIYPQIKISSTYYQTDSSITLSTISTTSIQFLPYVFLSGEIIAINTTGVGVNLWLTVFEFSDSVPITRNLIANLSSGDNTIYTCPTGKMSYPFNLTEFVFDSGFGDLTNMFYRNGTGGSITFSRYFVKSGDTPNANNLLVTNTSGASFTFQGAINNFSPGDAYIVNTNSASTPQIAWVNLIEVPI